MRWRENDGVVLCFFSVQLSTIWWWRPNHHNFASMVQKMPVRGNEWPGTIKRQLLLQQHSVRTTTASSFRASLSSSFTVARSPDLRLLRRLAWCTTRLTRTLRRPYWQHRQQQFFFFFLIKWLQLAKVQWANETRRKLARLGQKNQIERFTMQFRPHG